MNEIKTPVRYDATMFRVETADGKIISSIESFAVSFDDIDLGEYTDAAVAKFKRIGEQICNAINDVAVLRDNNAMMLATLRCIRDMDYRGNRHSSADFAQSALDKHAAMQDQNPSVQK